MVYDDANRLAFAMLKQGGTKEVLHKYDHGYDSAGNRFSTMADGVTDLSTVNGISPPANETLKSVGKGATGPFGTLNRGWPGNVISYFAGIGLPNPSLLQWLQTGRVDVSGSRTSK